MGLLRVTRESVASMKTKGAKEGHIININRYLGRNYANILVLSFRIRGVDFALVPCALCCVLIFSLF